LSIKVIIKLLEIITMKQVLLVTLHQQLL